MYRRTLPHPRGRLPCHETNQRRFGRGRRTHNVKQPERERLTEGRRGNLVRRAQMMRALRGFFEERDFLEVETPVLVPTPGLEVHLKAVGRMVVI